MGSGATAEGGLPRISGFGLLSNFGLPSRPNALDFSTRFLHWMPLRPGMLLLTRIVESWFGFVAERRPRVAVGFSPRWRTKRVGVAERRLNGWQMRPLKRRSATRILASGNRGLKPTATVIQSLRDTGRKRSV